MWAISSPIALLPWAACLACQRCLNVKVLLLVPAALAEASPRSPCRRLNPLVSLSRPHLVLPTYLSSNLHDLFHSFTSQRQRAFRALPSLGPRRQPVPRSFSQSRGPRRARSTLFFPRYPNGYPPSLLSAAMDVLTSPTLRPFFLLSYPTEQVSPQGETLYLKGPRDLALVATALVAFTILREVCMRLVLAPLFVYLSGVKARTVKVGSREMRVLQRAAVRFSEQGWLVLVSWQARCRCCLSSVLGALACSWLTESCPCPVLLGLLVARHGENVFITVDA